MSRRVLSIGQCGFDQPALARMLTSQFDVEVEAAEKAPPAHALQQGKYDLVLVNRILDADGSSGLEVIQQMKSDPRTAEIPVMLVTNYAEYQQQAVDLGAALGFGKKSLAAADTVELLRRYLQ